MSSQKLQTIDFSQDKTVKATIAGWTWTKIINNKQKLVTEVSA